MKLKIGDILTVNRSFITHTCFNLICGDKFKLVCEDESITPYELREIGGNEKQPWIRKTELIYFTLKNQPINPNFKSYVKAEKQINCIEETENMSTLNRDCDYLIDMEWVPNENTLPVFNQADIMRQHEIMLAEQRNNNRVRSREEVLERENRELRETIERLYSQLSEERRLSESRRLWG